MVFLPGFVGSISLSTREVRLRFKLAAGSGAAWTRDGGIIGIDNLNVLRGVAKLLSQGVTGTPLPLVKEGDLLATIHTMLCLRGMDTVKVSKVKGHATQAMADSGDVRSEDLVGNKGADAAADLGRSRQQDDVITAQRDLLRVRRHWYPIILDLHKLMVAISRVEVNHDGHGGSAPDAMVWDRGGLVKPRASLRIIVDHATLPGPLGFFGQHLVYLVSSPHALGKMSLSGPTVSTSSLSSLPFWPHCIGFRVILIWANLAFHFRAATDV